MIVKIDAVRELVEEVEARLFDGLQHPTNGTLYRPESEQADYDFSVARVVTAYQELTAIEGDKADLLARVYLLARDLVHPSGDFGLAAHVPAPLDELISAIAQEGRQWGVQETITFEERERTQRLFVIDEQPYAIQLRHPERGCSASLCSNCLEPVAFADQLCQNCGLTFIGPFYTPNRKEWDQMTEGQRLRMVFQTLAHENQGRLRVIG
jgi:hypothetical protein